MHQVATVWPQSTPSGPEGDEHLARHTTARLLITASSPGGAEALARRIHDGSLRASFPLVKTRAIDFPGEPRLLRETCCGLLDAAAGGTLLITDVDELAPIVQERLVELFEELEGGRAPAAAVRLISGTKVSLLDRVAAGAFSDRLFYRLNIIHLRA
jgi:DNA-binding NtrC family response regulator